MEALVAIGLASNIVSFVDFGLKLLSHGRDLHSSIDGLTTTHSQLITTASRLNSLCNDLKSERSKNTKIRCKHDVAIAKIAEDCIGTGKELHSLLQKLSGQSQSKWSSMKKAIQSAWKDSEIQQMSARLQRYVTSLHVHLTASLNDSQSALSAGLASLTDQHRQLGITLKSSAEEHKDEILEALKDAQVNMSQGLCDVSRTQQVLMMTAQQTLYLAQEHIVIKALRFPLMRNRFNNIHDPNVDTYDWVYNDEHLDHQIRFSEWLREGQGTYFITGKPGSGKSTMMKHIHEHPRTAELLQEWAGESSLVTTSFFFWNSGVACQKSQEGFFRTLLHDILQHHPDLIHADFQSLRNGQTHSLNELINDDMMMGSLGFSQRLETIFRMTEGRLKFCVFVDGVDEYDGNPTDIVDAIKKLTKTPNVKLCVSSRPWNIFELEFKCTGRYYLEMHKHTAEDMQKYVRQTLENNDSFKEAALWEPKFLDLTQLLVTKAEGVFLWTFLVARKVRENLVNGDTIEHCMKQVDALSSDLDEFFTHMLITIPIFYREEAAKAILMALAAEGPIPVLTITMALDQTKHALEHPVEPIPELRLMRYSRLARRQLKVRCQDLFEPAVKNKSRNWMVKYRLEVLHRSIYDWLRLPKIQKELRSRITHDYDPNLHICEGYLLQLKSMPTDNNEVQRDLNDLLYGFLRHAKILEDQNSPELTTLLKELSRTMRALRTRSFPQVDWIHSSSLRPDIPRLSARTGSGDPLLPYAVRWRLNSYLKGHCLVPARDLTAENNAQNMDGYCPLYLALLEQMDFSREPEVMSSQVDTVKLLLDRGAYPNQLCGGRSVWSYFIEILQLLKSEEDKNYRLYLITILEMMVKGFAKKETRLPLQDNLKQALEKDELARIESIFAQHNRWGWEYVMDWFSAFSTTNGVQKENDHGDG